MSAPATSALGTLLLVGCGKMGGALLRGWRERRLAERYVVVEPAAAAETIAGEVSVVADSVELPAELAPDLVVLAVKPQIMGDILAPYRRFADRPFLSIAAGKTLSFLGRSLGGGTPIIRAMPNTPAAIGRGIAVACANAAVSPTQREVAGRALAVVGEVAWVDNEALMDAVTAVSGSGPAYVFLLIECLAQAGSAAGLPPELAARLALATVAGAGELARQSAESPGRLRENVTSPGGTTRAALDVLMARDGLEELLTRAVLAATQRSRELAE